MILVRLQGGLGNQMFQYALGRYLAIRNNAQLKLDITMLRGNIHGVTKRDYRLSTFNIEESLATEKEIGWFRKYRFKKGRLWFWYNRLIADRSRYAWEEHFNFEPWVLTLKDPVYLDGFWNTEKYFKDIANVVRSEFTLRNKLSDSSGEILSDIERHDESVSIHVRRGDYVTDPKTNAWHGVCSVEYYDKAIQKIAGQSVDPRFFIFSDDPVWTKEHITTPFPTTYTSSNTERSEEDMYLMSRCKHNIIANSSFSWWGGWLNNNPGKIVISPKNWFKTPKMDVRDLVPDTWVKL